MVYFSFLNKVHKLKIMQRYKYQAILFIIAQNFGYLDGSHMKTMKHKIIAL